MYEDLIGKDLTGLQFGDMRVIREYHGGKYNHLIDECECICGNIFQTSRNSILHRNTTCCPQCLYKKRGKNKRKDLTGQKFERLFVKEYHGSDKYGRALWLCLCDCGKEVVVPGKSLLNGNTKSCGCYNLYVNKHGHGFRDLTGERFGNITVLHQIESIHQGSRWHCICDCGIEFDTNGKVLRSHLKTDCGKHGYEKLSKIFKEDLTGQRFGHITIISEAQKQGEKTMWHYQCDCGRSGIVSASNAKRGMVRSCGKCSIRSVGEDMIENFLRSHHILFEREKSFIGCKYIAKLRFDFYLYNHNIAIEYDGEFHYEETTMGNNLQDQKLRDQAKNEYCDENEIILIRIPYWERDNIERILCDALLLYDTDEANSSDVSLSA